MRCYYVSYKINCVYLTHNVMTVAITDELLLILDLFPFAGPMVWVLEMTRVYWRSGEPSKINWEEMIYIDVLFVP